MSQSRFDDGLSEEYGPGEKGLTWADHDGVMKLCRKGMFGGKCAPIAYASKLLAAQTARVHGGEMKKYGSMYHIVKGKSSTDPLTEEVIPHQSTVRTIKSLMKDKYSR